MGGSFHSYVSLPEGNDGNQWSLAISKGLGRFDFIEFLSRCRDFGPLGMGNADQGPV